MTAQRDSLNSTGARLWMWCLATIGHRLSIPWLYGSPSLAFLGLRPTWRWAWSGASADARRVSPDLGNVFAQGLVDGHDEAREERTQDTREAWSEYDRLAMIDFDLWENHGDASGERAADEALAFAQSLGPRPVEVAP